LSKVRYWKLTPDEIEKVSYDENKLINWDIKCTKEPEEDAVFFGVFLYRAGTPFDYVPINGITYFHNNIDRKELPVITKFLTSRFGGSEMEKGDRIFLKDSKEIYSGKELAGLAKDIEKEFNMSAIITLEFQDFTEDEQKSSGLPNSKLLPLMGK